MMLLQPLLIGFGLEGSTAAAPLVARAKMDPPKVRSKFIYKNKTLFHPLSIGFGLDTLNSNMISEYILFTLSSPVF